MRVEKLNSKGSAFFIQERVGKGGKPFKMYKFRTMVTESEAKGAKFTSSNDSRIIPMGRFLRKFRIDELPQLINVLRGEMSIIGPRPEQVGFAHSLRLLFAVFPTSSVRYSKEYSYMSFNNAS